MLFTILSLIAGFAILYLGDQIPTNYLYLIMGSSFILISFSIFHPLLKSRKDMVGKTSMMINILLLGGGFGLLIAAVVYYFALPRWSWPLIFSAVVLLRKVLRTGVRITVKEPRSYGIQSETERGEVVASKSEKRVADWLFENGYNYIYEETIEFPDGERIKYDFYLPDTDIYIEYWGMAGVKNKDGDRYRERKAEKIETYNKYKIRLMSLYPTDLEELDKVIPESIARLTGEGGGFSMWLRRLFFGKPDYVNSSEVVERIGKSKRELDGNKTSEDSVQTFCPHCGHKMEGDAVFCDNCGKSTAED